jgi:hypothetical protein
MLVLVALLVVAPAAPAEPSTTVVAPLRAVGVPADTVIILTAELRTLVGRSKAYRLVTPEEMGAIDGELERQLSGGCDEASCVAELGGALGAKYLITGQVGKLGKLFTLQLKMIDIEIVAAKRTASGHSREIEGLLLKLPQLAGELLGEARSKPGPAVIKKAQPTAPNATFSLPKKDVGATLMQIVYRPPGGLGLRASLQLGTRVSIGGGVFINGDSTQVVEGDIELTFMGSQRGGFRVGLLGVYRAWTWERSDGDLGGQTGTDMSAGPIVGYRLAFSDKVVVDVALSLGVQHQKSFQGELAQTPTTKLSLLSGGIGIGISPF